MCPGGLEVCRPVQPTAVVVDKATRIHQNILAVNDQLKVQGILLRMVSQGAAFNLHSGHQEVRVGGRPAAAKHVVAGFSHCEVFLGWGLALSPSGGEIEEIVATGQFRHDPEERTDFVQVDGIGCQVHTLVRRCVGNTRGERHPVGITNHGNGEVRLDESHQELGSVLQYWQHVRRDAYPVLRSDAIRLEERDFRHQVIDGGALYVDPVLVELIPHLVADPAKCSILPLLRILELWKQHPDLKERGTLHGEPVAASLVVAVMASEKFGVVADGVEIDQPSLCVPGW